MIGKCANPNCSRPFRYLREGRIFSAEITERRSWDPVGQSEFAIPQHRVQFFWLCDTCSRRNTLAFHICCGSVKAVVQPLSQDSQQEFLEEPAEELCGAA